MIITYQMKKKNEYKKLQRNSQAVLIFFKSILTHLDATN